MQPINPRILKLPRTAYGVEVPMTQPTTANLVTERIDMSSEVYWSIQGQWNTGAGTLAGTITIEGSNVVEPENAFTSNDWVTLTTSPSPIPVTSGAGSALVRSGPDAFKWMRCKFTFTSGSGILLFIHAGRGWV